MLLCMSRRAVLFCLFFSSVFSSFFPFFFRFFFSQNFPPASASEQQRVVDEGAPGEGASAVGHGRRHPAVLLVGLHQGLEGGLGFLAAESFLGLP